jgi:hypothetical protein
VPRSLVGHSSLNLRTLRSSTDEGIPRKLSAVVQDGLASQEKRFGTRLRPLCSPEQGTVSRWPGNLSGSSLLVWTIWFPLPFELGGLLSFGLWLFGHSFSEAEECCRNSSTARRLVRYGVSIGASDGAFTALSTIVATDPGGSYSNPKNPARARIARAECSPRPRWLRQRHIGRCARRGQ